MWSPMRFVSLYFHRIGIPEIEEISSKASRIEIELSCPPPRL